MEMPAVEALFAIFIVALTLHSMYGMLCILNYSISHHFCETINWCLLAIGVKLEPVSS